LTSFPRVHMVAWFVLKNKKKVYKLYTSLLSRAIENYTKLQSNSCRDWRYTQIRIRVHTTGTVHMCDNMSAGLENGKVLSDGGFNTFKLVTVYYRLLGDVFTSFFFSCLCSCGWEWGMWWGGVRFDQNWQRFADCGVWGAVSVWAYKWMFVSLCSIVSVCLHLF